MSNVIQFSSSALSPYLGVWLLDPLSVSRNKVTKKILGDDNLKMLWAMASMSDVLNAVKLSQDLSERYALLLSVSIPNILTITKKAMEGHRPATNALPEQTIVMPILSVKTEAKKVIVQTSWRGSSCQRVLRMNHQWLLITERMNMVPDLTHRYYRELQPE